MTNSKPANSWLSRLLSFSPRASRAAKESDVVFPPDFLSSIERLRLVALKAMGGGLREGHRLGAYKGGQLEFHGHRSYTPGDELRYVDWNTFARLGKPFVKEFAREEAGIVHLLLDATPSMSLGAPSKWTFARRLTALFAHVALSSKDIVYLYVFGANGIEQFPQRGASCGIQQCLQFLQKAQISAPQQIYPSPPAPLPQGERGEQQRSPASGGTLSAAVTQFLKKNPQRGRVILISDFWDEERDIISAIARLTSAGFDPAGIHVLAQEEMVPDADGELLVRSIEEETELPVSGAADLSERYARELEHHRAAIEETFRKRGGNYLLATSDTSIERVLITALRQRRWVM